MGNDHVRAEVIMVDGYDAEAQVEALSTLSFYRDCARALGEAGILVVNLWGGDRNFTACVERIAEAFNQRVACLPAGKPGNVVVLAFKRSPGEPLWEDLSSRARVLEQALGLEFTKFVLELALRNPRAQDRLLV
jgi:spermidine synthase